MQIPIYSGKPALEHNNIPKRKLRLNGSVSSAKHIIHGINKYCISPLSNEMKYTQFLRKTNAAFDTIYQKDVQIRKQSQISKTFQPTSTLIPDIKSFILQNISTWDTFIVNIM